MRAHAKKTPRHWREHVVKIRAVGAKGTSGAGKRGGWRPENAAVGAGKRGGWRPQRHAPPAAVPVHATTPAVRPCAFRSVLKITDFDESHRLSSVAAGGVGEGVGGRAL